MLVAWPKARTISKCNGRGINQEVIKLAYSYVFSCGGGNIGDVAGFLPPFSFAKFKFHLNTSP